MENNPRIKSFLGYIISWTAPKWFDPDKSQETCQCAIDSAAFVCVCQTWASPHTSIWMFPKIGIPQNGWFIMDDLGVPLFSETPIYFYSLATFDSWGFWMPDIQQLKRFTADPLSQDLTKVMEHLQQHVVCKKRVMVTRNPVNSPGW